jgi:hypothetical protein
MTPWYLQRPLALASLALSAACVVALWSMTRAVADPPIERSGRGAGVPAAPSIEEVPGVPATLIARTVDRDLFHPERRRPRTPFRLPAEEAAARISAATPVPVAPLRLLGTVITPGADAFAMGQLGNDAPRVVRVGDKLGSYTLRRIEPGRAVFIAPNGETMDLRVPKAGP